MNVPWKLSLIFSDLFTVTWFSKWPVAVTDSCTLSLLSSLSPHTSHVVPADGSCVCVTILQVHCHWYQPQLHHHRCHHWCQLQFHHHLCHHWYQPQFHHHLCSRYGSDRSSLYVGLSCLVQQIKREGRCDVFTAVRKLRAQRQAMMQHLVSIDTK